MTAKKAGWILFAAACAAFAVSFVFALIFGYESMESWRAFSVCIPLSGACFIGAVIAAVIDYKKK